MQVKANVSEVVFEMAENDAVQIVGSGYSYYELRLGAECIVKMSANRIIELRKEADQAISRRFLLYEKRDKEEQIKGA